MSHFSYAAKRGKEKNGNKNEQHAETATILALQRHSSNNVVVAATAIYTHSSIGFHAQTNNNARKQQYIGGKSYT